MLPTFEGGKSPSSELINEWDLLLGERKDSKLST